MAMLEDDMQLEEGFKAFVEAKAASLLHAQQQSYSGGAGGSTHSPPDLLALGTWGEGYVTTLASARRVLRASSLKLSSILPRQPYHWLCSSPEKSHI